jgi:hypothetical protein
VGCDDGAQHVGQIAFVTICSVRLLSVGSIAASSAKRAVKTKIAAMFQL